jgi:hypothetical protein
LAEAEAVIREQAPSIIEDLMWMGPVGFGYYVDAAIRFLGSPAADADSDSVCMFLSAVEYQVEHNLPRIRPASGRLAAALGDLLADLARFDIDPDIYGDVPARVAALRRSLGEAGDA